MTRQGKHTQINVAAIVTRLVNTLLLAVFCLGLAGCGTFVVKVEILPVQTETTQALATTTAAAAPTLSATATPLQSTATALASPTPEPTPTLAVAEPITMSALQMFDERRGWAVESVGRIIKTGDGGGLWQNVTPAQALFESRSLYALNTETAWAVPAQLEADNVVWRTQDGGNSWAASQPIPLGAGTYRPLGIQFPDARNGWLLILDESEEQNRQVLLYKSVDGGEAWQPVKDINDGKFQAYLPPTVTTMAFLDGQTGWLGGWWGKDNPSQWLVLQTGSGGARWGTEALRLPAQPTLQCNGNAIAGMPAGSMAVELTCTLPKDPKYMYHRLFYLSTNGEAAWRSWVVTGKVLDVHFLNAKQGWMLVTSDSPQVNHVLYTKDGGGTWDKVSDVAWKQAQFAFVNDKTGWAIVGNGFATALVRTENGGKVWIQVRPALLNP